MPTSSFPFRFAQNVRNLNRLRTIAQVLTKHGFGHLVDRLDLRLVLPFWKRSVPSVTEEVHEPQTAGERLARVCNELGPTYIKLGQMLSTRPDLLPADIITGLKTLQDQVEPFPAAEAKRIVQKDLGLSVEQVFQSFDDRPFASGSIAQAHKAVTRDGQTVVIKIRRPGIEHVIRDDMQLLIGLAESAERYMPEIRFYHPTVILEEFRRNITRELDFIHEASATARFYSCFKNHPQVRIPQVRWDLTGPRVLALEWIDGIKVDQILRNPTPDIDVKQLAENIADVFLKQYFEIGLFHADPHPGNLLILPPAQLGLIDFGMVGRVSDAMMTQFIVALLAAVNRQVDLLVDILAEVGEIGPDADIHELQRDLQILLDKYYGLPLKRIDLSTVFNEVADVVRRNDITLPRDFVLLVKSLGMTAATVLQLNPEMDLVGLVRPRLKHLLLQRFSATRLAKGIGTGLWHIVNILKDAPAQLRQALRQLNRGQWQIKILHQNLDRLAQEMDRSSNRLALSMIISSTIIGSSMMLASGTTAQIFGIDLKWFGIAGYVAAGFMGLWLVWAIFRSGRLY